MKSKCHKCGKNAVTCPCPGAQIIVDEDEFESEEWMNALMGKPINIDEKIKQLENQLNYYKMKKFMEKEGEIGIEKGLNKLV